MLTSNLKKEKPTEVDHILPNLPLSSPLLVILQRVFITEVLIIPISQWQYLPLKQGSSLHGGRAPHVKWKSPWEREHLIELVIATGNQALSSRGW